MTGESLIFFSAILVTSSLLMAIFLIVYDKHRSDELKHYSHARHGKYSIFTLDVRGYVIPFLLYLATAYAADLALEWLAAIALTCFFAAVVVNRLCAPFLMRAEQSENMGDEETDRVNPAIENDASENQAGENSEKRRRLPKLPVLKAPESIAKLVSETASLLATIVGWTAIVDLFVLLGMVLVETVIPHYMSLLGSWL